MFELITNIWFFVVFIPLIYLFYRYMQCFDFEKILKKNRIFEFKVIYFCVSVILAYLFASAFCAVLERIYAIISSFN